MQCHQSPSIWKQTEIDDADLKNHPRRRKERNIIPFNEQVYIFNKRYILAEERIKHHHKHTQEVGIIHYCMKEWQIYNNKFGVTGFISCTMKKKKEKKSMQ
ncbi:hypothetical protein AAZV13_10G180500 [Glycine max]